MASSTGASIGGGPNGLVLVVDDYEPGLYSKCRALTEGGFTVLPAKTGADALELVARDHPGVVVLDVRLPDTDGVTVCRSIKRDPATAATMVLQVSAYYTS